MVQLLAMAAGAQKPYTTVQPGLLDLLTQGSMGGKCLLQIVDEVGCLFDTNGETNGGR
jgi:hypothetical protein